MVEVGFGLYVHVPFCFHKCHYCDFSIKAMPLCPVCGEGRIGTYGMGTERLEKEVAGHFPQTRIARMDSDTTSARGAHEKILRRFSEGKIDILIGRQVLTWKRGDSYFIPAGTVHGARIYRRYRGVDYYLDDDCYHVQPYPEDHGE